MPLVFFQESPPFLANNVFEWPHMLPNHSWNTTVFWMAPYVVKPFLGYYCFLVEWPHMFPNNSCNTTFFFEWPHILLNHSWSTTYCFPRILTPSVLRCFSTDVYWNGWSLEVSIKFVESKFWKFYVWIIWFGQYRRICCTVRVDRRIFNIIFLTNAFNIH